MHVRGGEIFAGQVRDPVTDLVVTRRGKASLLVVKGMVDGKSGVAAVAVMREFWGLYAILQPEGISPFLRTKFRPIYRGRLHFQPCPRLSRLSQSMCALGRGAH